MLNLGMIHQVRLFQGTLTFNANKYFLYSEAVANWFWTAGFPSADNNLAIVRCCLEIYIMFITFQILPPVFTIIHSLVHFKSTLNER